MTIAHNAHANRLQQRLQLYDGRFVGYDEYGPADGTAVLYLHGAPGSRLEYRVADDGRVADHTGVHVIAVDRPGVGLSSPSRAGWAGDIEALADHLGTPRFAVLGFSGGAPAALGIAAALPDRLTAVGLVSAVAPHDVPGLTQGLHPDTLRFLALARDKPLIARLMLSQMRASARLAPGLLVLQMMRTLPAADQLVLGDPMRERAFVRSVAEAMRHGTRGVLADIQAMVAPLTDDLAQLRAPVVMWHGDADQSAPVAMAHWLHAQLNAQLHLRAREGHISTLVHDLGNALSALKYM